MELFSEIFVWTLMKQIANISIELQASNVTIGFGLGHDHDLWIFKVKCGLDLWPHTWFWPGIFMVKFWNSCISDWKDWLTLNKVDWSRSFMTMTVTIWSSRSGTRIYQIVTGVASDVSVPSTHLVVDNLFISVNHLVWNGSHNYRDINRSHKNGDVNGSCNYQDIWKWNWSFKICEIQVPSNSKEFGTNEIITKIAWGVNYHRLFFLDPFLVKLRQNVWRNNLCDNTTSYIISKSSPVSIHIPEPSDMP